MQRKTEEVYTSGSTQLPIMQTHADVVCRAARATCEELFAFLRRDGYAQHADEELHFSR